MPVKIQAIFKTAIKPSHLILQHHDRNFYSSSQVQNCEICKLALDNYHLFKCTRKNTNNITYEDLLNGNILEQKNAIKYLHEGENWRRYLHNIETYNLVILFVIHYFIVKDKFKKNKNKIQPFTAISGYFQPFTAIPAIHSNFQPVLAL